MIEEVELLAGRIARLLEVVRRLGDENVRLREELSAARARQEDLSDRMEQARTRVEVALSRLPAPLEPQD
jgi:uncharacterized protein (TIGR02449 family)